MKRLLRAWRATTAGLRAEYESKDDNEHQECRAHDLKADLDRGMRAENRRAKLESTKTVLGASFASKEPDATTNINEMEELQRTILR